VLSGREQEVRALENQVLLRALNERIRELNRALLPLEQSIKCVCECSDLHCTARIELTLAEYEDIRAHPDRFALAPGHAWLDGEHVVEERDRYVVIAKLGPSRPVACR
jgi:hypothetical protein